MRRKKKAHVLNQAPFEVYKTVSSVTRHLIIPSIWPQIPSICRFTMAWGSIRCLSPQCYKLSVPGALSHSPFGQLLPLGQYLAQNLCSSLNTQGVFPSSVLCLACQSAGVLVLSEHGQQRLIYILYMTSSGMFVNRYQLFTTCSRREGTNHKDQRHILCTLCMLEAFSRNSEIACIKIIVIAFLNISI